MLLLAFNNSDAIKSVIKYDGSDYGEPIFDFDDKLIDSLAHIAHTEMLVDSINGKGPGGRHAESPQGKRVFRIIIEKMESKWLDNIAKTRCQSVAEAHDPKNWYIVRNDSTLNFDSLMDAERRQFEKEKKRSGRGE